MGLCEMTRRPVLSDRLKLHLLPILIAVLVALWRPARAAVTKNSAPFDPFRLECPFYHGIVKLELRRVESSEGIRTDTMITAYCENVKKLYPSPRDPTSAANDENCRWTAIFKIPGKNLEVSATCSGREFVAGISRQALGEYSMLCCNLRDRKVGECSTAPFTWPNTDAPQITVEQGKHLLSSIGFKNGQLVGRFCDYGIMTKQELDAELAANAKALLLSQAGQDGIKGSNRSKNGGRNGDNKNKLSIKGEEEESDGELASGRPKIDRGQSTQKNSSRKLLASSTTPLVKISSPRPRSRTTATQSSEEYEYGDSGEVEQGATHAGLVDVNNGVVKLINDSGTTEQPTDVVSTSIEITTSENVSTNRRSTTKRKGSATTTPSGTSELDADTTPEISTQSEPEITTSTQAETTAEESSSSSSAPDTSSAAVETSSAQEDGTTPIKEDDAGLETSASTGSETSGTNSTQESPETSELAGTDATKEGKKDAATKRPKKTTPVADTATPTPATSPEGESETDLPSSFTVLDPARFQVLGVPKPGIDANGRRPHGLFIQPSPPTLTKGTTKGRSTKKPPRKSSTTHAPSEEETSVSGGTLAPAPPARGGDGSGDVIEMEHEGEGSSATTTVSSESTESGRTKFIQLASPPVPSGNLSSISGGVIINSRNATVESAVAPFSPIFGTRTLSTPLSTASSTGSPASNGRSPASSSEPSSEGSGTPGGTAAPGVTPTFTDASGEADRIECDTEHAWKDNSLVVACGQGKDIWSPPRCPPNTFCLMAKDSVFRICCPVRVG